MADEAAERYKGRGGVFFTTRWSVVLEAGAGGGDGAREALEYLCRTYWYPLYSYVRRGGKGEEEAKDLTQGFFLHLLERDVIAAADAERGKFRTFLLAALKNYVAGDWRKQQALKRGGGVVEFSLDAADAEERFRFEPEDGKSADVVFDQRWARALLERVFVRMREEFERTGRGERFEALKPYLLDEPESGAYAGIAEGLGMTVSGVRSLMQRVRGRFAHLFRDEIEQTVSDPGQVDEELGHLLDALSV